jgi:adenine deaminase
MEQAPLMEMLTWPETMGINEPPAANLIQENGETIEIIAAALSAGKLFPGHAVGITDEDLDAYAAVGASSCHESVTPDQIILKLRRGLKPWLRHGSAAPDLVNVLPAVRAHPDWMRWTCLCSDEVDPADLYQKGGMDFKVRLAVENGIAPIDAIRMATINPAEYYRVDDRLGSVSPGKLADLVVTESLSEFQVRDVVVGGRVVMSQRRLTTSLPQGGGYPDFVRSQTILRNAMNAGDFEFHVPTGANRVRVRVIGVADGTLVSQPLEADLPVVNGNVESDITHDVLKLAVIDRHTGSGRIGLSFTSGFRLQRGAVSTTYCHPFYQLLVLGTNDADMARAANIMREIGGGIVVVDGENVEQWELSLVGIYTAAPFADAQREFLRINQAIRDLGCPLKAPVLALSFVALQTIPTYGLSDKGLFDARVQGFVSPVLSAEC